MTYEEIAKDLGVKLCTGCLRLIDHDAGFTSSKNGVIHWRDRNVTKPGLYNFLKLYVASIPRINPTEWWMLWKTSTEAYRIARRRYHTIIPRRYSKTERAKVLFLLRNTPVTSADIYNAKQWAKEATK